MSTTLQHGTRNTYVLHKCRCDECRTANTRYQKRRVTCGVDLTDSTPAREHIAQLRAAGLGRRTIARRAGVSLTTIDKLAGVNRHAPARRMRSTTLNKILAVTLNDLADGALIDATVPQRQLQALIANGHSLTNLARRIGWKITNLSQILHLRSYTTCHTADLINQLYQDLHMTPGNSVRARNHAIKYGWLPPLAWNDITDPDEQPDPTTRRTNTNVELANDELIELIAEGHTFHEIAARFNLTYEAVERRYYRHRPKSSPTPGNTNNK